MVHSGTWSRRLRLACADSLKEDPRMTDPQTVELRSHS